MPQGTGKNKAALAKILPMVKQGEKRVNKNTTAEQLQGFIIEYFEYCRDHDMRPGIEGLCFYLGITKETFRRWTKGEDRRGDGFQEVAQYNRQALAAYMEYLFQKGEINPVVGIFLMKNWYGYKDTVQNEIEVKPSRFGEDMSNEQIAGLIEE